MARAARRESRLPGSAAAHGIAGGIPPRLIKGKLPEQLAKAREASPRLERLVENVVKGTGARVALGRKGRARAEEKLERDYYGDPSGVRDLARGTIIVNSEEQLATVLRRLKRTGSVRGASNEWSGANSLGYQHGKVWLDVDGHIVELQITTPGMIGAKEDGGGHALYERWRSLPEGPEKERLAAQSRALYAASARSSEASRSSSDIRSQRYSGSGLDRSLPTPDSAGLPASSVGPSLNFERIFASTFPTSRSVRQSGVVVGRPWSRHPVGRAGQRAYDRFSGLVETTRGPGAMFSSSRRAARMKERELRKERARTEAEVTRLERVIRKGVGKLGRSREGQEALIATLEAPAALTPRQAVEVKLADLRSTIERPRSREEAKARLDELDRDLQRRLRPLVDRMFPPAARRREQGLRNVLPHTRGKRAAAAIGIELEVSGIGSRKGGGSVLADAYEQVEQRVREVAERTGDPTARRVAALLEERDALRASLGDPEVVFGDKPGEYGLMSASPAAAARLRAQTRALERALQSGLVDRDEFARAVEAATALSRQAEGAARQVLGMSEEQLAARRNRVAQRYAERGLLPEGVEPEARGFFPHRDEFERVGGGHGGAVGMPAAGVVVGVPQRGRAFERRRNELRLYEQGRVQPNPRVLSNTVRQRERFLRTHEGRRWLYEHGRPIRAGEPVPEGYMLVRNPDVSPEQIPPSVRAAIESPERYAEIVAREGEFPEPRTWQAWLDTWLYRGGPEPEWLADLDNVRAVPERVVRTLLADAFASAPRGSFASLFGSLNALARATTIYLPYGGARYVARNTPQNMILLALTQPRAFARLRSSVFTVRREEPDVYAAIVAEAGTIPAAAGLPELAGMRRNAAQRAESGLRDASARIADWLGRAADEPWRVASWLEYARQYGFATPQARRELLFSDRPEIARVRDDIAQRVRDDMLDFDALTPWERETISRYLFVYAFRRASAKWPFVFAREHPARAALLSLVAAQHEREETPGRVTSALESGRTQIGGREVDLGWLMPHLPAAETIEDAARMVSGVGGRRVDLSALRRQLAPQYRAGVEALGYGTATPGLARSFLPGYSTVERVREGGGLGEQALRFVGSDVRYIEPGGDRAEQIRAQAPAEKRALLRAVRARFPNEFREEGREIARAFDRETQVRAARAAVEQRYAPGEQRERAKLAAELDLLDRWGALSEAEQEEVRELRAALDSLPLEQVRRIRDRISANAFENLYRELLRNTRRAVGSAGKDE
ncbi:MAG TPA: hypothetical protein VNJ53_06875 [Gaiellaceae bacterium]|nr:hypothetical protein [Gaiellaceae bacterium]